MRILRSLCRRGPCLVLAGLGLLALAGCGSGGPSPVHGRLLYEDDDTPVKELAGYDVTFTSEKLGTSARGTIEEDGSFDLTTKKDKDGAAPGEYVVILSQPHRRPERKYVGDPVVDLAYEDPGRSDLKAEVKSGANDFTFKLRRLKRK